MIEKSKAKNKLAEIETLSNLDHTNVVKYKHVASLYTLVL